MKRLMVLLLGAVLMNTLTGCASFHWYGRVPDYEKQSYIIENTTDINNIILQEEDELIEIRKSHNQQLYVSYYVADDDSERYVITEENNVLQVKKEVKQQYGIFVFGDRYTSDSYKEVKLSLFLPDGYEGDLIIETLYGDMEVGDITIPYLSIYSADGDVNFTNTAVSRKLYCCTEDGDINGTLAGSIADYNLTIETTGGNSNIKSRNGGKIKAEIRSKEDGDINIGFEE